MSGLTYLITGAARGLGKGVLAAFVARPNTTVIAAVRNVKSATSALKSIPVGEGSKIIIVKIDSESDTDAAAAVEELKTKYSITHIDVLLSNAGYLAEPSPVVSVPADAVRKSLEINTIAPMILLQAFKPLLDASPSPRFFVVSSSMGSIEDIKTTPVPFYAYSVSKAAVNYMVRKVAFENPELISLAVNPGWVKTDMGTKAANLLGMDDAPVEFDDSIKGLLKLFDEASLEKTGTFTNVDGKTIAW
jgi:norsolorinic acid ketoreductase